MEYKNDYKNRRFAFCGALFFIISAWLAQTPYFQQEVNYRMDVRLNDDNHSLSANSTIEYINNSTNQLHFIYFHLWPNAYRSNTSALAKQLLDEENLSFHFSKAEEQGYIDSLDFKVNGEPVKWLYDSLHADICKIYLNQPLGPNERLQITTPFYVKIPDAKFSRLGHSGQAYFITQWYPKPAVFDREGWHPMPYLNQGEFYSEFGSFDVRITLPENYLLAATGDRENNPEEDAFLNTNIEKTRRHLANNTQNEEFRTVPVSSTKQKTIRFIQHHVHDFAWFANKQFYVVRDSVELPETKRRVATWTYFTPDGYRLWRKAINYVNESTLFYSELLGDYPYNNVTAIDGTIMAGGGMEYPNITVIGVAASPTDLEMTIAHEVGHNWFYGILGSDERRYPFMDEGLNSFFDMRYLRKKYPEKKLTEYIGQGEDFRFLGLNQYPHWKDKELAYMYSVRQHNDQPLDLPAPEYTGINYGTIVYGKAPVIFDYLRECIGTEEFDKAMKVYYNQFKFKHPSPEDLFNTLSSQTGFNLDTFKAVLVSSTRHMDYKISSVKKNKSGGYELRLKNKSQTALPSNIAAFKNGVVVERIPFKGFNNRSSISFTTTSADYFKIDEKDIMPDINRRNNVMKAKGLFKRWKPLQLNFITKLENPAKTQVNYFPLLGANVYDGFMPGLVLHNYSLFRKRVEYYLAPMYGIRSKNLTGFGELYTNFFPKRLVNQVSLGASIKSYTYDRFDATNLNIFNGTQHKNLVFRYIKLSPFLEFDLRNKTAGSSIRQLVTLTSNFLITDSLNTTEDIIKNLVADGPQKKITQTLINQVDYEFRNKRTLDPYKFAVSLQQSQTMIKVYGRLDYQLHIAEKHYFDFGLFAGVFLSGTVEERGYYAFRPSGYSGSQDYLLAGNYLARNGGSDFGNSQFMEADGNLKIPAILRNSSDWMLALNIKSPKLFVLPLRLFADVLVCDARSFKDEKLLWDMGLNLTLIKGFAEVYIPFAYSAFIKNTLELNKIDFYNRIRFTVNIHKLVPRKIIRNQFL